MEASLLAALGERYPIEREIAHGAMATVYLARDRAGGRQVAVKVMHPRLADALGAERFQREIAVVRAMDHPLIVPLYASGDAGGTLYYVMPFVPGETLAQRLERERRLPCADALRLAADIADALGYAHARGVLHRDIKPENILLQEGRALVADFGLARAIGAADYERLTQTGVVVGTAHYMSPEQLLEDRDLDQRTDIYSLACILFEMLTGSPPFTGPNLTELATRILRAPPPSARQLRAEVSERVDRVIVKALAKSPADRFATMEDFAAVLREG
ncbi:MAG TPA: serine/threonine-protein kinase [Gemmatimonadales bacterium]|nr:serine/threonine-protein kinase [Gemmatimonadales bacterium]